MSSNWPSALVSSSSSRSLNSSPVETLNETNSSSLAMVQGEVKDLSSKVQELQNAYEEYLDAEQVGNDDVSPLNNRMFQMRSTLSTRK